jgi:hypothetical protein
LIVRRRFDSCAYCAERCSNAVSLGLTCRITALNCWRTCRSFLGSCGGRKDQRAQKCSNSSQLRPQLAAWFICGLIGTLGFFSRALEVRLARLRGTDRGTVRFFVCRPVLFRPKKPPVSCLECYFYLDLKDSVTYQRVYV